MIKTWADAIREQNGEQPAEEEKKSEKFMGGFCRCGHGGFTPSVKNGEYIRVCKRCGSKYNVDREEYI